MRRYTEELKHLLGIIIYGTAQVYDEPLEEVYDEAFKQLDIIKHPKELFRGSKPKVNEDE